MELRRAIHIGGNVKRCAYRITIKCRDPASVDRWVVKEETVATNAITCSEEAIKKKALDDWYGKHTTVPRTIKDPSGHRIKFCVAHLDGLILIKPQK